MSPSAQLLSPIPEPAAYSAIPDLSYPPPLYDYRPTSYRTIPLYLLWYAYATILPSCPHRRAAQNRRRIPGLSSPPINHQNLFWPAIRPIIERRISLPSIETVPFPRPASTARASRGLKVRKRQQGEGRRAKGDGHGRQHVMAWWEWIQGAGRIVSAISDCFAIVGSKGRG